MHGQDLRDGRMDRWKYGQGGDYMLPFCPSKAVILLLSVDCLLLLQLCVCFVWFFFCAVVLPVLSSFTIMRKRELVALLLLCSAVSVLCLFLPVGRSVVCDCSISQSYSQTPFTSTVATFRNQIRLYMFKYAS